MTTIKAMKAVRAAVALTDYEIEDLDALWGAIRDTGRAINIVQAMGEDEIKNRLYDLWDQCRLMVPMKDMIEPIVEQAARDMGIEVPGDEEEGE